MASLFDIAKSGVQSYRQALAVTGQNIANINTDGYKRRDASLEEITASQGGVTGVAGQAGLGVRVATIRRSFDEFLLNKTFSTAAEFERVQVYLDQLKSLENTLLPSDADLGSQMNRFFTALQDVAAAPGDLPPRIMALEEGRALADSFKTVAADVTSMTQGMSAQATDAIDAMNLLSGQLGEVNARILSAGQSGQAPNSVMDLRDRILGDMAALADISVEYTDRGVANVSLGSSGIGPTIVDASQVTKLDVLSNGRNLQIYLLNGANRVPTNQISKGLLAGLVNGYEFVQDVAADIDHLAFVVAREMNTQHTLGLTMDGSSGSAIFSTNGLIPDVSAANRGEAVVEIEVTSPYDLPADDFTMTYRSETESWVKTRGEVTLLAISASEFNGTGFSFRLSGAPKDGDTVSFSATRGSAAQMQFLLVRPQDLAAAGATNVMQDTANESDAVLSMEKATAESFSVPPSIDQIFRNGDSPIVATQFLKDSVVAAVPAGAQNLSLSSYAEQARAQFELSLNDIRQAPQMTVALQTDQGVQTYVFDLSFATAFPREASDMNWEDLNNLVDEMNRGNLRAASGESLADLGIFASGAGGNLTLAAAFGSFAAATNFTTAVGTISKRITAPADASTIQIFTREGRHLAGAPLTTEQINTLLSTKNGFSAGASYRGDYLNDETDGYRGLQMDVSRTGGMERVDIGANGTAPSALGGVGLLPPSATDSYSMSFTAENGRTASLMVPAGASAGFAAGIYNRDLAPLGIQAQGRTRVSLGGFTAVGTVNFNLESINQDPLTIKADIAPGNLNGLVEAINAITGLTGVTAILNDAGDRVIMEANSGEDIMISRVTDMPPQFYGEVIDDDGRVVSDRISFHAPESGFDSARFSGTLKLTSSAAFSATLADTTMTSRSDPFDGGLVALSTNNDGTRKSISFTAHSEIDINLEDATGRRAVAASGVYSLAIPQTGDAPAFSARLTTAQVLPLTGASIASALVSQIRGQAPIASLSGQTDTTLPVDGDRVQIRFAGELYSLTMENSEIVVSGGEAGRITAYFDKDGALQVVSGGTISGAALSVPVDSEVAGNSDAAARWGIAGVTTNRFAGAEIDLAGSERSMTVSFGGATLRVGVDENGVIDDEQLTGTGLVASWRDEGVGRGRLVLQYGSDTGPISFSRDLATEALGFKTASVNLRLNGDRVDIISTNQTAVEVEASGDSLARQRLSLSNLPNEDLIIVVTGGSARSVSAAFDLATPVEMPPAYDIRLTADGGRMEIIDAETGHSIATRTLNAEGVADYSDIRFRLAGQGAEGDVFHVLPNLGGTGDARNLDAMMRLQSGDIAGPNSGGFRQLFAQIVTQVGAAVRSNGIALEASEASRDAALEAEMSFSGVNLDVEAAALLEYQQAYQASARVLSTARELFQTLMDVV